MTACIRLPTYMVASASDVTSRKVQLKRSLEQISREPPEQRGRVHILAFMLTIYFMLYNSQYISLAIKPYIAIAGERDRQTEREREREREDSIFLFPG